MDVKDIKRFPTKVTHIYAFISVPFPVLKSMANAWNSSGDEGPTWLISIEDEDSMESFGFNVEFVGSLPKLMMAGKVIEVP